LSFGLIQQKEGEIIMRTKSFIFITMLSLIFIAGPAELLAANWFDTNWYYRQLVTVDNNSNPGTLTNYPVKLVLNSANFDFAEAKAGGEDLRFTADDGSTLIDFWIEDYNSTAQTALVWVEVPSIAASSAAHFYMYYDNPSAASASNGTATFDLFDDFSGSAVDSGKWNSGGTPTVSGGMVTIDSGSKYIRSKQTFLYKAMRTKSKYQTYASYGDIGFNVASVTVGQNDAMFVCLGGPELRTITSATGGGFLWGGNTNSEGTDWKIWEILWKAGEAKFLVNGNLKNTHVAPKVPSIALYAQINDYSGNPVVKSDWLLVRNYSSPEPSTTAGQQEGQLPVPAFTSVPVTEAFVGVPYSYDVDAENGEPITYELTVCPNNMTIDANTGLIEWTPAQAQIGLRQVTVKATNSNGSSTQNFEVSVSQVLDTAPWGYKRIIEIDNTYNSNTLTNYPVKIILDGNNFDFTDANAKGNDIRFTKANGLTEIDHWIESWDSIAEKAIIWAEVPQLPANEITEICMYYGNPDANSTSNGEATFEFFDDFEIKYQGTTGLYGNWPRVVIDNTLTGSHNVLVEDVDLDGKPDIVADAYVAQKVVWYKQPADPVHQPWTKYTIDSLLENAHDIQIGDIDGDGRRDVVGLSLSSTWSDYGAGEGYLCWYKKPENPVASGSTGWTVKASLPYHQGDGTAAIYNNEIYVFGGHYMGVSDPRNEAYKYNPLTDTWTQLANMPTARWGPVAVECNGLIHVFAGESGGALAKHEVYNPALDSWSTWSDVPSGLAQQGLMGIKYGSKIYLFYWQYTYEYDPVANTYTQKANVPTPRTWATCALVNNKIYLIAGYSGGATNVNEVYDPVTNTWETKAPMPVSKYGVTRENPVINGKIYVTHGLDGGFHTDNYVYDTNSNTWQQKSSGLHPRDGIQSAVINNKLYVIAGRDDYVNGGTGTNYVEEYDPLQDNPGNTWTKTIIAHSGAGGLLGARSMSLGDIDGDGDLDIAVAIDSSPGRLYWYQNPGGTDALNPAMWHEYLIDSTINRGADAQIGDLDGDGNPDIVYADVPAAIYVYFAPDDPTNIGGWTRVQVAGDAYHVSLVDFDGDGDLDILRAGAYSALVSWIENPGGANARNPANWREYIIEQNSSISIANRVSAADIDGDGDLDIGMDADPSGSTGIFKWYRRPSNPKDVGSYQIYTIDDNPAFTAYAHDSYLADIDKDGDIDMVGVGPSSSTVLWWINDPCGTSTAQINPEKWDYSGAELVDGVVTMNGGSRYLRSKNSFQYKALRTKAKFENYNDWGYIGYNSGKFTVGKNDATFISVGGAARSITSNDTTFTWGYNLNEGTNWKTWDVLWKSDEVKFCVDDILRQVHTTTVPTVPLTVQFNSNQQGGGAPVVKVDWALVRSYQPPEPNTIIGDEIPIQFTITATADENGTIDPNGEIQKAYGQSQLFSAIPDAGFEVDDWLLDGDYVQVGGLTYTLEDITASHTIEVTFKQLEYSITATAGSNGTVDPNGGIQKAYGQSQLFTAAPDIGYEVDAWSVDGNSVQVGGANYTLMNITQNHAVNVSFKQTVYTITASGGANGTVDPNGAIPKTYGQSQLFTANPSIGYEVDVWSVDGNSVQVGGTNYTFENIIANHNVNVTFKQLVYTITATFGANGTVDPNGGIQKAYGQSQLFTAVPDIGYEVDAWFVDGNSVQVGGTNYTLENITDNHNVNVTFKQSFFAITVSAGSNGTVDPNGAIQKAPGSSHTFTATANADSVVNKWYLDGNLTQTGGVEFHLTDIQAPHTVSVSFCLKADFNKDDKVDSLDLLTFTQHWLSEVPDDLCNLDGIDNVEFNDLAMFAEKWMNQ
jgi:hypothetical protein